MNNLIGYAKLGNQTVNIYGEFFGEMNQENTEVVFQNGEKMEKRYFYNLTDIANV